MDRKELIDGLRMVADLYEKHPNRPLPPMWLDISVLADTREQAADAMRILGSVEKGYYDNVVQLAHQMNPSVRFNVCLYREQVCRKITRQVTVPATAEKV